MDVIIQVGFLLSVLLKFSFIQFPKYGTEIVEPAGYLTPIDKRGTSLI